jgi:hypothetical protein
MEKIGGAESDNVGGGEHFIAKVHTPTKSVILHRTSRTRGKAIPDTWVRYE